MTARPWVPELDGVRGVAVLAVVVHHVYPWERIGGGLGVLGLGWSGVDLFFVLSGFLITGILLDTAHQPGFWRRFAIRRALRILPLYWPLVGLILAWHLATATPTAAPPAAYPLFLCNWWIAWLPKFGDLPLNIAWSLAIEEQFYLTWPPLVRWLPARALPVALAAALVAAPLARWWIGGVPHPGPDGYLPAYVLTPCRLDAIGWGCAAMLAWRAGGAWVRIPALAAAPLALALVTLAVTVGWDRGAPWFRVGGYSLLAATAAAALLAVRSGRWPRVAAALRAPWLRLVGRVSFGVYLLHPIGLAVAKQLADLAAASFGDAIAILGYPVLGVALTLALAAASWWGIEARALRLKDRLAPDQ